MALDELARDRMITFAKAEYEFWMQEQKNEGKFYFMSVPDRYKEFCKFYDVALGAEGRKAKGKE